MIFSKSKPASGSPKPHKNTARTTPPPDTMKFTAIALPCLAAALLSSCASVSVRNEHRGGNQPKQKPAKIYVQDFGSEHGIYKIAGDAGKDLPAFKKKTADTLANYLVAGLSSHAAPAQRVGKTSGVPKGGWLVTGEFVRVHTGSRLLRAGVGLGAGGTKMETRVAVYDGSCGAQPFLTFETTGGSNAMPGLLTNPGTTAAISITTQAMMGVTDDAARSSRMITGEICEYFVSKGWLEKSKSYSVKRLGKFQLVHEQYTR